VTVKMAGKRIEPPCSQERLKEVLDYDPDTGVFRWKCRLSRFTEEGAVAGNKNAYGYIRIGLNYKHHYAHKLAWFFVTGEWPSKDIDHINGVRYDNRLSNLRLATRGENVSNSGPRSNNSSGYKGVYWNRRENRWAAQIRKDGVGKNLGYFDTPEDAAKAYEAASVSLFGDFALTSSKKDI